eukprot:UN01018
MSRPNSWCIFMAIWIHTMSEIFVRKLYINTYTINSD